MRRKESSENKENKESEENRNRENGENEENAYRHAENEETRLELPRCRNRDLIEEPNVTLHAEISCKQGSADKHMNSDSVRQ